MTRDVILLRLACSQVNQQLLSGDVIVRSYEVTRDIAAAPETVWAILTDAGRLQNGGFGITRIVGQIVPNGRFRLWSDAAPGPAFHLRVTAFDPPRRMVWTGGMPLGLFTGVRSFTLAPIGNHTRLTVREDFTGLLLGLIWRSMPDLQPSFTTFGDAAKKQAEAM